MHIRSGSLLALMVLAGCTGAPDLDTELATVASWTATVQLAAAEHRAHALTSAFVAQLEDAAREALADARQSLPASAHDDRGRQRARAAVDSLDRALAALDAEARR